MSLDGIKAEYGDLVYKSHFLCVENLTLPSEEVDELGYFGRKGGTGCNEYCAFCLDVGYGSGFGFGEEVGEFGFGLGENRFDVAHHRGFHK